MTLANLDHLGLTVAIMMRMGAACPSCGFGTRVTSKRWAKCKRCGERVERRSAESVREELRTKLAGGWCDGERNTESNTSNEQAGGS
jgi:tRNA(Ile2) C34 agmatinyltransferase TiaS